MNKTPVLVGLALTLSSLASAQTATLADYQRAQRYISWNNDKNALNAEIAHHWIGDSDRLWYKRAQPGGAFEFVVVDVKRRSKVAAFDHEAMARALSSALGKEVKATELPVEDLRFESGKAVPDVVVSGQIWTCELQASRCDGRKVSSLEAGELAAPGGKQILFVKDHNLWLKDAASGQTRALTEDGNKDNAYSVLSESSTSEITMRRQGRKNAPIGIFSPDGSRFVTYRLDQSRVKPLDLLQYVPEDGSFRPIVHEYRYPFPGDEVPMAQLLIFDLTSGNRIVVDQPPLYAPYMGPVMMHQLRWSADGRKLYLLDNIRDYRTLSLFEIDGRSGQSRKLLSESDTINYLPSHIIAETPLIHVFANGDFLWPSERSGYLHLYRYDGRTGKLKNAVTSGQWIVRDIVRVDERAGEVYFTAVGLQGAADPYYRALYRVKVDGTGLKRLTAEDADHDIKSVAMPETALLDEFRPPWARASASLGEVGGFSPKGRYFVDSYSTPVQPTVTVVRNSTGAKVMTLETATLAPEVAAYIPPEPFKALAADGKTPIYGQILKPTTFDKAKRYPVIDAIYPGPQIARVPKRYFGEFFADPQAIAELGFIVIEVDGRGTPLRSHDFRAFAYGNMGGAGALVDHVAAIKQVATSRPYMDLDRVGMYGTSGGGFATVHAMFDYPDFYKVGVASAGNHDQRSYISNWGEIYHGAFDEKSYATIASYNNVANFKGKLLLACGDMDDNVHPANTMRVANELIKHNKQFDMLVMPNVNHAIAGNPYFMKRLWDYLVVNLQGGQSPVDFVIAPPK